MYGDCTRAEDCDTIFYAQQGTVELRSLELTDNGTIDAVLGIETISRLCTLPDRIPLRHCVRPSVHLACVTGATRRSHGSLSSGPCARLGWLHRRRSCPCGLCCGPPLATGSPSRREPCCFAVRPGSSPRLGSTLLPALWGQAAARLGVGSGFSSVARLVGTSLTRPLCCPGTTAGSRRRSGIEW